MAEPETDVETPAPEAEAAPELHGAPVVDSHGQTTAFTERDGYQALMEALRADGFDMCVDVCGVDYLSHSAHSLPEGIEAERFEVVVNLVNMKERRRVRVRVQVPESDPTLPSLFPIWPSTEAFEREVWDMFGIAFTGHPDLTRILMPEDWEGHPLRKDYAIGRVPVQFKATNGTRSS